MHQPIDGDGGNGNGRWRRFRRVNKTDRVSYSLVVVDPADRANGAIEHLSSDDLPESLVSHFALTLGFGTSTQFSGYAGISGIVGAPS